MVADGDSESVQETLPAAGFTVAEQIDTPTAQGSYKVHEQGLREVVTDKGYHSGVDSFEVAPDRVTFYIWPRGANARFHFVFRPPFAMTARSAQSVLYDYYNPDERVVLAPKTFTVE